MASNTQHRCVFVGNIPYDATEEQLMQICEEVGPVVSFRLVLDRETGKPKGFGFCEYKDEETALSARRNLQGYEINGRQLRVDFADSDKSADRNREQGRGGPGLASNIDFQKHSAAATVPIHQPLGFQLAESAAAVMAGHLDGDQTSGVADLYGQGGFRNDPLTHYLAKMSREHLHEVMTELKALVTQNKSLARRLLQANPHLSKAVLQAQIMLGMATPQMLQIRHVREGDGVVMQPQVFDGSQKPVILPHSVSTPVFQIGSTGLPSKAYGEQMSNFMQNPLIAQPTAPPSCFMPVQSQINPPQASNSQLQLQGILSSGSGVFIEKSVPMSVGTLPATPPQIAAQIPTSLQPPPVQQPGKVTENTGSQSQPALSATATWPRAVLPQQPSSQFSPEMESALLQQVLGLTPEQLSLLPVEQRQQVIQLQQMLRG